MFQLIDTINVLTPRSGNTISVTPGLTPSCVTPSSHVLYRTFSCVSTPMSTVSDSAVCVTSMAVSTASDSAASVLKVLHQEKIEQFFTVVLGMSCLYQRYIRTWHHI